jgi:hypothetical protein
MAHSKMAMITFFEAGEPVDPGYGVPGYGGGRPDNSLPSFPGRPDNSLPGGGHIITLPVFPFDPTVGPDNTLPNAPEAGNDLPRPGRRYIVKWLACYGLILVPDNELPPTAEPK